MTLSTLDVFDSNELMEGTWLPQQDTGEIRTLIIEYAYIPEEPLSERELVAQPIAILYSLGKQLESLTENFSRLKFIRSQTIPYSITNYQQSITHALVIKIYRSFWHAAPIAYFSCQDFSFKTLQAKVSIAEGQSIAGYIKQVASMQVDIQVSWKCKRKVIRIPLLPFLPFEVASLFIQQRLKKNIRNDCLRIWISHFFQIPGSQLVSWDVKWLQDSKCIPLTSKELIAIQTMRKTYSVTDPTASWDIEKIIALVKLTIKKRSKDKIPNARIIPISTELVPTANAMVVFDHLCETGMTALDAAKKIGSKELCLMLKRRYLHQVAIYRLPRKRCRCCCSLSACWKAMINCICSRSRSAPVHDQAAVYRSAPATTV